MKLLFCSLPLVFSTKFPDLIKKLDSIEKSWTSGHNANFDLLKSTHDYDYLNGVLNVTKVGKNVKSISDYKLDGNLPENFDWRDIAGDYCPSLLEIRDQGHCGSCWAFGAVESFTDRLCIQSQGQLTADMSAEDLQKDVKDLKSKVCFSK